MNQETRETAKHLAASVEKLTDIAHKLAGPAAEQIGLALGDRCQEYRIRNLLKIMPRVEEMLRDAGINPTAIPGRLFLPALEAASVEDNPTLQEKWAALLANAANPETSSNVLPSFVETLKQITPEEALFLDQLYIAKIENHAPMFSLRHRTQQNIGDLNSIAVAVSGGFKNHEKYKRLMDGRLFVMMNDLARLGIVCDEPVKSLQGAVHDVFTRGTVNEHAVMSALGKVWREPIYALTVFGIAFLTACHAPLSSKFVDGNEGGS